MFLQSNETLSTAWRLGLMEEDICSCGCLPDQALKPCLRYAQQRRSKNKDAFSPFTKKSTLRRNLLLPYRCEAKCDSPGLGLQLASSLLYADVCSSPATSGSPPFQTSTAVKTIPRVKRRQKTDSILQAKVSPFSRSFWRWTCFNIVRCLKLRAFSVEATSALGRPRAGICKNPVRPLWISGASFWDGYGRNKRERRLDFINKMSKFLKNSEITFMRTLKFRRLITAFLLAVVLCLSRPWAGKPCE